MFCNKWKSVVNIINIKSNFFANKGVYKIFQVIILLFFILSPFLLQEALALNPPCDWKLKESNSIKKENSIFDKDQKNFLEENKIEVVSGVNLPMLLKLSTLKGNVKLKEAVRIAEKAGKESIIVASELLDKKKV